MARQWNGNLILKEGWTLADEKVVSDGVTWAIMYFDQGQGYVSMKVAACGRAEHKANYWMYWSTREGRLVRNRESGIMLKNRPELAELVGGVMARLMAAK